jgi:hypothetical protein
MTKRPHISRTVTLTREFASSRKPSEIVRAACPTPAGTFAPSPAACPNVSLCHPLKSRSYPSLHRPAPTHHHTNPPPTISASPAMRTPSDVSDIATDSNVASPLVMYSTPPWSP